jgi:hypothetical protein
MKNWCVVLMLLLAGLSGRTSYAQPPPKLVSGDFQHMPFEQFVRELEIQTDYRFFFDPMTVDSLYVTLRVQDQSLPVVLKQAIQGKPLYFSIDDENRVFVSKTQLALLVPSTFFGIANGEAVAPRPADDKPVAAGPSRLMKAAEYKVFEIGRDGSGGKTATLAGHLREQKTGEPVIGASIYSEATKAGASTDQFGYYSLTLPVGRHTLQVRGVGIKNTRRQVQLRSDGQLEIEVEEDIVTLKEVVVEAEKDKNVSGLQMGMERLDIKTMRQIPTAFGETDLLRVVLTLPGVKSVGEGSTGLNVRGGSTDQNLILFNDAIIYNPSHLFGFFSAFNPDVVQAVELYKCAMPAKYGGRLSSVLDISTREGNKKKLSASGGIGPLTSRLTLEGPLAKDRSSFIISGRASYSDWILHQLSNKAYQQSSAGFYDLTRWQPTTGRSTGRRRDIR